MMQTQNPALADRVAVVTGAANGIGRAITAAFAAAGARVLAADIDEAALQDLAAAHPSQVIAFPTDATDAQSASRAVERVCQDWGGIDILVNNVGGRIGSAGLNVPQADWQATLALCLTSHLLWLQAAVPAMTTRRYGRIINIASNAGRFRSNTDGSGISYSAAKGGVIQLTRSAAHELGRHGITVNAIAPGSVMTRLGAEEAKTLDPPLLDRVMRETALGYFAEPAEMASIALFLASADASYVTGATLLANGGWCTA